MASCRQCSVPNRSKELHDHHSTLGRIEDRYHVLEKVKLHFYSGDATSTLLTGMPLINRFALRFVRAAPRREAAGELTDRIMTQVGRYMPANVATSVPAGLATLVRAWWFGIPYPALLGVLVAIMDLVPIIGSTVGGVVVSLVALAGGTLLGIIRALVAVPAATAIGLILEEVVFPARDAADARITVGRNGSWPRRVTIRQRPGQRGSGQRGPCRCPANPGAGLRPGRPRARRRVRSR
jgi:hypothetical protein